MVVREADDFAFQRAEIIERFLWGAEGVAERGLHARRLRANVHGALKVNKRELEFAKYVDERSGHFGPSLRADRLQPGGGKKVSCNAETYDNGT
jgi:hypothetical protein